MKAVNQGGFGLIGILVAVGIIAVGIGAYASLSPATQPLTVSDDFEADPTASGIENMAQNMAQNATGDTMQVVEERNDQIEAGIAANTTTETDIGSVEPVAAPAPTVAGTFTDYSADKLALAENGQVVLFFHADWCPSCRGLENDVNANLGNIPANTHILKLDYDTETELKKKYGVVRQHTLIVVDANGNEIKKLTGLTNTLDQVTNQL